MAKIIYYTLVLYGANTKPIAGILETLRAPVCERTVICILAKTPLENYYLVCEEHAPST